MRNLLTSITLLAAALALSTLAHADQILGPGRIDTSNRVVLPGGPTLGTWRSGKFTATPDALQIKGSGSTGDLSTMSVTPVGASAPTTLGTFTAGAAMRNYKFTGDFPLDSRAFVDAAQTSGGPYANYNTGAANAEFLDLTGTIPTSNPGAIRDGHFIMVRDRDTTPYELSGYRAITKGLRVILTGKADNFAYSTQSKDFHAGWFTSTGRTSGTGRGFSGILAEASQIGTGAATNELAASNPDYSNEHAAYLVAAVGHVHNNKASADDTHLSIGI
jgi:hypothetical protein